MNPGTLIIRADASIAMGTGHVMRCLALAQAWQHAGGDAIFAMAESTPAIAQRLRVEGIGTTIVNSLPGSADDANEVSAFAVERQAQWLVVDGYQFSSAYQRSMKDAGLQLLSIDDMGQCAPYCADFVLNQNVYACSDTYRDCCAPTTALLGPRFALLRREFLPWRSWQRQFAPVAKRLLITMGGSDPQNVSAWILNAAARLNLNGVEITVVIGGSNRHVEFWKQFAAKSSGMIRLQFDSTNMAELMAGADLAISAAGTTCYELALLQVPMVLITVSENQVLTAEALAQNAAAIDTGWFHRLDPERFAQLLRGLILSQEARRKLGTNARRLVDGYGAHRVCRLLLNSQQQAPSATLSSLQVGAV